ncbi:hypothetical protein SKAU_G00334960 [Synaphobranchus kaupii]|uniref:Uncharacterized protein n=1 Tax=Synaphobranchus kaupii TaxID=118154 RepID=A0A9Q1IHY8_SYNKA|nr:hypothetical protein SKAU_G00334960 [Synaphobranchus kaupii]
MSSSLTRADASSWQLLEVTTNPIISPPWRPSRQGRCDGYGDCHTPPSGRLPQRSRPSSWRDGERARASGLRSAAERGSGSERERGAGAILIRKRLNYGTEPTPTPPPVSTCGLVSVNFLSRPGDRPGRDPPLFAIDGKVQNRPVK